MTRDRRQARHNVPRAHLFHDPHAEHFMAMPAVNRRWTAREVRQLIEDNPLVTPRYELVDGELLVTPSPGRWHQRVVLELAVALREYLEREPVGVVMTSPSDVELEPEFLSQPDVFVVPGREWRRIGDDHVIRELILAAEVLSPSSGRHDRVRKRPKYQKHVPEYWILDLEARLVERWRPNEERPEILTERVEWHPRNATVPFVLAISQLFDRALDAGDDLLP
jgi:Uma2 family endonuclease